MRRIEVFCLLFLYVVLAAGISNGRLPPKPDTSETCVECREYVNKLDLKWTNNVTVEMATAQLKKTCREDFSIGKRQICDKMVDVLVQIPPGLIKGIESLAWPVDLGVCASFNKCTVDCCSSLSPPEQVHLSLASTDRSLMGVTYVTLDQKSTKVQYGVTADSLDMEVDGTVETYTQAGWRGSVHKATMKNLLEDTVYYYRVGGDTNSVHPWSEVFSFRTLRQGQDLAIAFVADMAYDDISDDTVKHLIDLTTANKLDVIVHSGDIGYADGFMPHWDDFFNKVQPIASRIPYMVTPGNHEFWYNFSAYKTRFYMPGPLSETTISTGSGSGDNMYYSWNLGPIHFVSMNTETAIDIGNIEKDEVDWLEADLKALDRTKTPWVFANFHRPLYCNYGGDCSDKQTFNMRNEVEDLFMTYKIDAVIYGHIHAYERTYPMYNNSRVSDSYDNPKAPVYLLQGASGNREGNKGSVTPPDELPAWSAVQYNEVGYAVMQLSKDRMQWTFFESSSGAALDNFVITKTT